MRDGYRFVVGSILVNPSSVWWLDFPEQWKPGSPWQDRRVRLAAILAVDRQAISLRRRTREAPARGGGIPKTGSTPVTCSCIRSSG
jgi:hypothetical protein